MADRNLDHTVFKASMACQVHLLNPAYCLRTSDLDMTQHWLYIYKLISVSGVWHLGTLLRPTIFGLVWLYPDQSCTRISQQGNDTFGPSFRPTIFCLACVGLLNVAETLKSVSGFMARVHDWDPPSTAWFGWIYWTSAFLLKWVMLSQLVTLQLRVSVSAGLVILPNSVV